MMRYDQNPSDLIVGHPRHPKGWITAICQALELKTHQNVGLCRLQTMPKHFGNNSTTSKKFRFFFSPKIVQNDPSKRQKE